MPKKNFTSDQSNSRLDKFLADRNPNLSRSRIKRLISEGMVSVDGVPRNAGFRLRPDQSVLIELPDEPAPAYMVAQDIPLTIIHEDDDLIVVDKPAGMPVHPGAGHPDSTLVNALLGMYPAIGSVGGAARPGLVHRLDKDTSGLIVVSRTDRAHESLTAQFKERSVGKAYLALVVGALTPPEAVIEAPIARDPNDRKKMAIVENGRQSTTQYKTIANFRGCTYAEALPKTGRTHQIRIHFASIGNPVVADTLYGRPDPRLTRHFLHAARLEFHHPTTGAQVKFHSPLPPDLQSLINLLK